MRISDFSDKGWDGFDPGYSEYGVSDGFPVLAFHGAPGSRLERIFSEPALRDAGIRLIVVERPGYGRTGFDGSRTLLDWPDAVSTLADSLGLGRFSVIGFSGGGPYAAACAYALADRLVSTALIGSAAPFSAAGVTDQMLPANLALFELALADYREAACQLDSVITSPEILLGLLETSAPPPDRATLADDAFRAMYLANLTEALRQGATGFAYDMALIAGPWGFELDAVKTDVAVWHGDLDANCPVTMGRYLAEALPDCDAHILAGHGHFLAPAHETRILRRLVAAAESPALS